LAEIHRVSKEINAAVDAELGKHSDLRAVSVPAIPIELLGNIQPGSILPTSHSMLVLDDAIIFGTKRSAHGKDYYAACLFSRKNPSLNGSLNVGPQSKLRKVLFDNPTSKVSGAIPPEVEEIRSKLRDGNIFRPNFQDRFERSQRWKTAREVIGTVEESIMKRGLPEDLTFSEVPSQISGRRLWGAEKDGVLYTLTAAREEVLGQKIRFEALTISIPVGGSFVTHTLQPRFVAKALEKVKL
jgi:hypothetical protein